MFRKALLAIAAFAALSLGAGAASTAQADHCHRGYYGGGHHRAYYGGHGYHGGYGYRGYGYRSPVSYRAYYAPRYAPHYHGWSGYGGYGGYGYGPGVGITIGF